MKLRLFLLAISIFVIFVLPVQAQTYSHSQVEARQASRIAEEIRSESAVLRDIRSASDALDRIKILAMDVRDDADHLDSYLGNRFSLESHAARLTQIKEDINDLVPDLETLEETEAALLPRQRLAMHHIFPDALVLSRNAENAIEYFNENPNRLWGDEYREAISTMYERADRIVLAAKMAESLLTVDKYLDRITPN